MMMHYIYTRLVTLPYSTNVYPNTVWKAGVVTPYIKPIGVLPALDVILSLCQIIAQLSWSPPFHRRDRVDIL